MAFGLLTAQLAWAVDPGSLVQGSTERAAGGVQAGDDGATFELPGGVRVVLTPHTQAFIAPKSQLLALWPGKRVPTHSVFLRSGRVDVSIPESTVGQAAVVVAAPDETRVIVKSGSSSVRASTRRLITACESGLVSVSDGARFKDVPPGKVRETTRTSSVDRELVGVPQLRGQAIWVVLQGNASINGYSWGPITGAVAYQAEIRDAATGRRVTQIETSLPKLPVVPDGLPPGNYHLYVRAVDQDGMSGKPSQALPIRVVGVDLPERATVQTENHIQLELGQSIRLTSAEGLSVALVGAKKALDPSAPIKLGEDRVATVVVRASPTAAPHLIWLVPRKAPLQAFVGPKDAIWPVDHVTLQVRSDGPESAEEENPTAPPARVYLGVEPLAVAWRRNRDGWRARIPPQPGRGPWVVRLEVYNRHGAIVARDFVEVVRMPPRRQPGPRPLLTTTWPR